MRYRFKCLSAADYHSLSQIVPPLVVLSLLTSLCSFVKGTPLPPGLSMVVELESMLVIKETFTTWISGLKYSFFMILSFFESHGRHHCRPWEELKCVYQLIKNFLTVLDIDATLLRLAYTTALQVVDEVVAIVVQVVFYNIVDDGCTVLVFFATNRNSH